MEHSFVTLNGPLCCTRCYFSLFMFYEYLNVFFGHFISVPITQRWREELKRFTEASGIKSKNPYTNTTSYQVPPTRQGSRQGERPPPSRSQEVPKNGEKPPSRGGEKPPSRNGEKPPSRQGDMPSGLKQGLPLQHITSDSDADLTVSTTKDTMQHFLD